MLVCAPVAQASAETLMDALALAYEGNPNLRAARAELRATDENVGIAIAGWRPTVILNGSVLRQQSESTVPGISAATAAGSPATAALGLGTTVYRTNEQMTATVTQPLFNGFKTVAGTAEAKNQVMAQRARLEQSEATTMLQVAGAYFDVLQNEAVVDLEHNNVQVLERNLEATNDRFQVGEITRTDVAQSQASLEGAKAALVQAEGDLQRARAAYVNAVGQAPGTLTQPELPGILPKSLDEAVKVAINDNPSYVASDYTARAQKDNIKVVQGDLLPQANLFAQYAKTWNATIPGSETKVVAGGAQLTVPLYQGGAEWARLRQAKDTYGQYLLLADQARLDARTSATTAWESFTAQSASLDSIRSQISANEISLEGVRREAEVGSRTVLDTLNAEQTLLNSRVQLVRTQHDQLLAAYQLLAAMGKLTAGDLGLGVKLYNPKHHYDAVRGQWIGTNGDTAADLASRKP
jgi:outer membrane protein